MGAVAARKARTVLENTRRVVAVELCCAAQAVDLSGGPGDLGRGTAAVYEMVRTTVPTLEDDRVIAGDLAAVEALVGDDAAAMRLSDIVGDSIHWSGGV